MNTRTFQIYEERWFIQNFTPHSHSADRNIWCRKRNWFRVKIYYLPTQNTTLSTESMPTHKNTGKETPLAPPEIIVWCWRHVSHLLVTALRDGYNYTLLYVFLDRVSNVSQCGSFKGSHVGPLIRGCVLNIEPHSNLKRFKMLKRRVGNNGYLILAK